jgi:hypothetical protein
MGAHPWFYFVEYQSDVARALQELREKEFRAGRYYPVTRFPEFPVDAGVSPGPGHNSVEHALESSGATGTRSILDMTRISRKPEAGALVPLESGKLIELYGTEQPTREMVEANMEFFAELERGHGIYLTIYQNGRPSQLLIAGYSYD